MKLTPDEIAEFQEAIRNMHGCDSKYVESVEVHEKMPESTPLAGQTVWQGTVHVFKVTGHPKAKRCYAWRFFNEDSRKWRYVAVLHDAGIVSPVTAVQAYIVTEYQRGNLG